MSKNNNSVISKAMVEMGSIKEAMQNESKETLKSLLSEAVKERIRQDIEDDCVIIEGKKAHKGLKEDDEAEVPQDGEQQQAAPAPQDAEAPVEDAEADAAEAPAEDGQEADVDMSQYEVPGEDSTYDLRGEQDLDKVLKVYKKLDSGDEVVVTRNGSNINLKDNQTGAEYVIDIDDDDEDVSNEEEVSDEMPEEDQEQLAEGLFEIDDEDMLDDEADEEAFDDEDEESFDDEDDEEEEPEDEFEFEDDEDDEYDAAGFDDGEDSEEDGLNENYNTMKKNNLIYEIDLGYTDDYQKKSALQVDSNAGDSDFDAGVKSKGTEKPFSSLKAEQEPYINEDELEDDDDMIYEEEDDEEVAGFDADVEDPEAAKEKEANVDGDEDENADMEEAAMSKAKWSRRHATKSRKTGANEHNPYVTKVHSMNEKLERIKNSNKKLKKTIGEMRKSLSEAYMTNINLGKIAKLFCENSTSQAEKIDIINRFTNESKTKKQANALYESINRELKASKRSNVTESKVSAAAPVINETKIYESADLRETKDFMKRLLKY